MQFTTLQKDMMQAMKDHDKVKKDALSALVSATKKLAIDAGCREEIPDSMTDQAILKEIKTLKEQIDTCPDSRMELKEEYKAKLGRDFPDDPKEQLVEAIKAVFRSWQYLRRMLPRCCLLRKLKASSRRSLPMCLPRAIKVWS